VRPNLLDSFVPNPLARYGSDNGVEKVGTPLRGTKPVSISPPYDLRRKQLSDSSADSRRNSVSYPLKSQFVSRCFDEFFIRRLPVPAQNGEDNITEDMARHRVDAAERVTRCSFIPILTTHSQNRFLRAGL